MKWTEELLKEVEKQEEAKRKVLQNIGKIPHFYLPQNFLVSVSRLSEVGQQVSKISEALHQHTLAWQLAVRNLDIANSIISNITFPNVNDFLGPAIETLTKNYQLISTTLLEEFEEENELYSEKEYTRFPFLLAGYLTIPEARSIKKEWKRGNKEAVKKFLLESLKMPEVQKEIIAKINEDPILAKRGKIIEDAMWAHSKGKYSLSIPTLFPIIEGVIIEKWGHLYEEKECEKCKRKYHRTAVPVLKAIQSVSEKSDFVWQKRYDAHIKHLLMRFTSNRIPILHGSQIDYESEELSAALILALYSLELADIKTNR